MPTLNPENNPRLCITIMGIYRRMYDEAMSELGSGNLPEARAESLRKSADYYRAKVQEGYNRYLRLTGKQ